MARRGIIIFTHGDVEAILRELSAHIASRGGRVLYRKVSPQPVFVLLGEVSHERV
ncbi:MAG: hypothetical protein NZ938_00350 [Aigarchaeota archaeon]|nr:hypothetical protein [Candidatus Calditenuaceae archaeon]